MNSKYTSSQAESLLDVVNSLSTTHYTQAEVNALIGNLHNVHTEIVESLPETGDTNVIYLISKGSSGTTGNLYDEYVYINGAFEHVGDFGVSLSGYVTQEQLNNAGYLTSHQDISGKADKSNTYTKTEVDTLLNNFSFIDTEIVTELPTENINTLCMYFVPIANGAGETNHYDEYMYINNQWEQMGSTKCECDMSDYEKKAWIGTTAEFNALTSKDNDRLYLITDGTTGTQVIDLSAYETSAHAAATYQPKGEYLTSYTETDPVFVASAAHGITSQDITNWNAKSTFDGNYNNLTNKPTIPSIDGLATTEQLAGKSDTGHTHTLSEITDYTAPTFKTINGNSIVGEGNITISGGEGGTSYDDTEIRGLIAGKQDAGDYALKSEIPSITGLATTEQLNGKSDTGHTHTVSDITDYTAPTTYTAGTGISITDGVISCTVEGGTGSGGGISQELYDSAQQATAKALKTNKEAIDTVSANFGNYYTKTQAEAKFVDNDELEEKLVDFLKSEAYHAIHDPQEKAIAAAFNDLLARIEALEALHTTD